MIDVAEQDLAAWPFGPAGTVFLALHGIVLPWLVIRGRKKLVAGMQLPSKTRHFSSTIVQLACITLVSLMVAKVEWVLLFGAYRFRPIHLLWSAATLALAVGYMGSRWRKAVERGGPILHFFSPETALERGLWLGVSLMAAFGEEITYRGVLTSLLERLVGSYALASLLSALLFGLAHMVQGWRSSAVIVLFALGFQALVYATGSLYVAMAVHFVYDVIAGLSYGRLVRQKREREALGSLG